MFKYLFLFGICFAVATAQRTGRLLGGVEDTDFNTRSSGNENLEEGSGKAEPYSFSYTADTEDGGSSSREESGDETGTVKGFYTLLDADGRQRRVDYIADADGFRAVVTTNEVGTESKNPADVVIESSAPTAEELVARYEAEFGSRRTTTTTVRDSSSISGGSSSLGISGISGGSTGGISSINIRQPSPPTIIRTQPQNRQIIRTVTTANQPSGGGAFLINDGGISRGTNTIGGGRRIILTNSASANNANSGAAFTRISGGNTGGLVLVPVNNDNLGVSGEGATFIDGGNTNFIRTTGSTRTFRTSAQPIASFVTNSNSRIIRTNRNTIQPITNEPAEEEN